MAAEVSEKIILPIFKDEAVQEVHKTDSITLEYKADMLSRNVGKQLPIYVV